MNHFAVAADCCEKPARFWFRPEDVCKVGRLFTTTPEVRASWTIGGRNTVMVAATPRCVDL